MSENNQSKCVNYEFCEHDKVPGIGSDYCMVCGSWFKVCGFGWDKLTIVDSTDECAVCMNMCERKLMFPTKCGHSFCINCSRNILFWDETRYHLSRVPYGCPPCPNGCENPEKGKQCYCEEYDSIQEHWEQHNPDDFNIWNNAEKESINDSSNDVTYGKCTCPLCRKKYVR
jgi:hypothetical protein